MKRKFIFNLNKSTLQAKQVGTKLTAFALGIDNKAILSTLLKEAWRIITLSLGKVKGLTSRVRLFNNFMNRIFIIHKYHGSTFTIKLLKANSVALQRFIAGTPYKSLREIEPGLPLPRLYGGLPSLIPKVDRCSIKAGHLGIIRYWLTMFNIYRLLDAPLKPNLSTITKPITGKCEKVAEFKDFVTENFWNILPGTKKADIKTSASYIFQTQKASPNVKNAKLAYFTDLCWWAQSPEDYEIFKEYSIQSKSFGLFRKFDQSINLLYRLLEEGARIPVKGTGVHKGDNVQSTIVPGQEHLPNKSKTKMFYYAPSLLVTPLKGGQLCLKVEPAGKVRVFAIVDIWTQSVLSPLHDSLFSLLRRLPNDGTFDQDQSFQRAKEKATLVNEAFSIDLSAATDRLPLFLQEHILNVLTGNPDFGKAWAKLLVDRGYYLPQCPGDKSPLGKLDIPWGEELKYAVGQPMGALSSWAMLALTHHCIVQYAAFKAQVRTVKPWFDGYEILGDDLVIFDDKVAEQYIAFMEDIGVDTNPSKSIPSPNKPVCEFAKRTSYALNDVSGLSWKELLQGNNLPGKINLALRLGERSLIQSPMIFKSLLVRFGNEIYKPLKNGVGHSLIGILGSLLNKLDNKSLIPALALLVDPANLAGEDYNPKEVTIPMNQAVQVILKLMNTPRIDNKSYYSEAISKYEDRVDFVKSEILPFAASTSYLSSLKKMQNIVDHYDHQIDILASSLIAVSSVNDKILKAQIRSVAEDIILRDSDPQDQFDKLYNECYKAAKYGMPLARALEIESFVEAYQRRFEIMWTRPKGEIPTDNSLAKMAMRAGTLHNPLPTAQTEFKGFIELGLHEKDWLVRLKAPTSNTKVRSNKR